MFILKYFLDPVYLKWNLPILGSFHYSLPLRFGWIRGCDLQSCAQTTGWNFIHSGLVELSNWEELLSNNPALPVGKMLIKQQIFKSILELFYEMQSDLAVRRCHGSFVPLCYRLLLEGGLGCLAIAYTNITCLYKKVFLGYLSSFLFLPINYGCSLQEIITPTNRS